MDKNKAMGGYTISLVLFGTIFMAVFVASQTASASVISDLPTDLGNALDISSGLAGMIMSVGILCSAGAFLALAKMKPIGVIIILVSLMFLLTAMQWLDEVYVVFTTIVVAI